MKKKLIVAALLAASPLSVMAGNENNIGSCGWGSKLWQGQRGLVPQIMATSTNGTSGNQTFAITSGTSGCTQDGLVTSNWKTAMFIDSNMNKLAQDMATGQGEALDSLANLMGVEEQDKGAFHRVTKDNFAQIFSTEQATSTEVMASLKKVLAEDATLAQYSAKL